MILNWLQKNKSLMNINIELYDWPKQIDLNYYDFGINLSLDGISTFGRGSDFNQEIAITKATAEAIERWVFLKSNHTNTSGFAAHLNLELAIKNARNELFERDAFFCHYLTKTAWQKQTLRPGENNNLNNIFTKFGFVIDVGYTEIFKNIFVSIVRCKEVQTKGITISLGCDDSLINATTKSLIEGTQLLSHKLSNKKISTISLDKFMKLAMHSPEHHGMIANNGKYESIYNQAICFSENEIDIPLYKIQQPNIKFEICKINALFDPFIVVRAYSEEIQPLFFGKTEEQKINQTRINGFLQQHNKQSYNYKSLELFPHPLA